MLQKQSLRELAIKWNCFDQATDLLAELQYMQVSIVLLCIVNHCFYSRHQSHWRNYSKKLSSTIVQFLLIIFFE